MLIFRRIHCIHAEYGTVTLNESSWCLSVHSLHEISLKLRTDRPRKTLIVSDSTVYCMYTIYPPEDEHLRLETCRGI